MTSLEGLSFYLSLVASVQVIAIDPVGHRFWNIAISTFD